MIFNYLMDIKKIILMTYQLGWRVCCIAYVPRYKSAINNDIYMKIPNGKQVYYFNIPL